MNSIYFFVNDLVFQILVDNLYSLSVVFIYLKLNLNSFCLLAISASIFSNQCQLSNPCENDATISAACVKYLPSGYLLTTLKYWPTILKYWLTTLKYWLTALKYWLTAPKYWLTAPKYWLTALQYNSLHGNNDLLRCDITVHCSIGSPH